MPAAFIRTGLVLKMNTRNIKTHVPKSEIDGDRANGRARNVEQKTNLNTQFRIMFRGPTANYV